MSSTWKYVEKCIIMNDMAEGLLSRLYSAKRTLADPAACPPCVSSKELSKVRDKLEKSFPDTADLTKVSGSDNLRQNCQEIVTDLMFFNDLILDVCEFRKAATFLLKEIATSTLQHFKLDKHRPIVMLFFELLSHLYRVVTLVGTVKERKSIFALYTTANSMSSEPTDIVGVSDAVLLFDILAQGHRHFIDEFHLQADFVGDMMLEFYESLLASSNPETLRSKSVLNPSNDGDNMTHPVKLPLTARPDRVLAMHSELRDAHLYLDFIAFGFLVCPSLLFQPESKYMEIFRVCVTDQLVVTLYRELNINLHGELESIFSVYPSKKDTISVPKGFKIKNILKDFATTAVQSVGIKHRERRSFILAEVKNLLHLAQAVPGLLGPKFPVYVAAASMARAEILHYFRHRPLECRKDVKKHLNGTDYFCTQITLLIDALYELTCVVEEYKEIVTMYYGEYLSICDAPALEEMCSDSISELPENSNDAVHTILLSLPTCARSATQDNGSILKGMRLNWDRYSTLLGTVWGKFAGPGNTTLMAYMMDVQVRSEFVDGLDSVMKRYFLPYELWWHMPSLSEAFEKGFELNAKPLCFFSVLSHVSLNIHDDNLIEAREVSRLTWKFCDRMMGKLNNHLTASLDTYWSLYDELEKKTLGKEAMSRLEKQYLLKQARDKAIASGKKDPSLAQPEQHPGYESEGWASNNIASLKRVRSSLMNIMIAVKNIGTFFIFNREYNIEFAMHDAFTYYFSSKLKKIISQKNDISRPSIILKSVVVGCRVMQSLCNIVSFDLPQLVRSFLFDNFSETSIPPPGTILSGRPPAPPEDKEALIWSIGRWFMKFVDEASAQNSGLMWVPSTNSFARADSKQRPIDIYINREEMASLCAFIGPQGVRCIESLLIQVVVDKVAAVKNFIAANKGTLLKFSKNITDIACLSSLDGSAGFMAAAVQAGVALALRQILHLGMSDSMQSYAPFLKSSVESIASSVDPWVERDVSTPLFSLIFDAGVIPDVDLALVASLAPLRQTPEDINNLSLLHVAFAACLVTPYWTQNSVFLPEFGAFRGNQHCIALTMSKFILCFTDLDESTFSSAVKSNADSFVELSASVILSMRDSKSAFNNHPVRAYTNILELFLQSCPLMDHYALEKYLPYAFVHASQMEIAMGQVKGADSLNAGMNRVIRAESAATQVE